jgi:hypothetical protein
MSEPPENAESRPEENSLVDIDQLLADARIKHQELQEVYSKIENLKNQAESIFATELEKITTLSQAKVQEISQTLDEFKSFITGKTPNIEELNTNFNNTITKYTTTAEVQNTALNSAQTKLSEKLESLTTVHDECVQINKVILNIKEESSALKAGVDADIANIKQSNTEFSTLLSQSKTLQEEVSQNHSDLQQLLKDAKTNYNAISSLHTELLTGEKDASGKVIIKSLNEQITELHSEQKKKSLEMSQFISERNGEINKFTQESKEKYKKLKQNLESEIRELLPGAGAAGLSSAYVQAKSRYGHKEYDKEPFALTCWPKANALAVKFDKCIHVITGNFSTIIYYVMFLAPLIYMFYHIDLLFKDIQNIDLKVLIFKSLLSLPLGLVSWFGFSSIRLNRRLYEEYNHKQRVMQLYHGFKQEIEEHGSEEHKKALIAMMINAVQDKPSLAMHKYDQGGEDFFKSCMSNIFFPSKNEQN